MPHKSRIAIGDHQMPFPLLDIDSAGEIWGGNSRRIDDDFSQDLRAVRQTNCPFADSCNFSSQRQSCSARLRPLHQEERRARRRNHSILGNEKASAYPRAQVGLETLQLSYIEHLRGYTALTIISMLAMDFDHFLFVGR